MGIRALLPQVGWKRFFKDLWHEINEDEVTTTAAGLAYYLTLAIFPALLFLLSLLPFLPIENLDKATLDLVRQVLPSDSAAMLTGTILEITNNKKTGLLSFGALATIWAASSGTLAIMQGLNTTYDVRDGRSFIKQRAVALVLTLCFGVLIVLGMVLVVVGGQLQDWLGTRIGVSNLLLTVFAITRWVIIVGALLSALAIAYYFGPDVKQEFRFITPGSVMGAGLLILASLGIQAYVTNFANYDATYGSIGAMAVLMLWMYVAGLVMLLGSEVNALVEHYSVEGKQKGEKVAPPAAAA